MAGLSSDSIVVAIEGAHVTAPLGSGEHAILGLERTAYFGVSGTASVVWTLVQSPVRVREIVGQLTNEFDVDDDTCERDVLSFLEQLEREGLVRVVDSER